jgi:hypothetical protein
LKQSYNYFEIQVEREFSSIIKTGAFLVGTLNREKFNRRMGINWNKMYNILIHADLIKIIGIDKDDNMINLYHVYAIWTFKANWLYWTLSESQLKSKILSIAKSYRGKKIRNLIWQYDV